MGNDLQIEIVLGKSEKFDSLMIASAPAPAPAPVPASAPASEAATKDNDWPERWEQCWCFLVVVLFKIFSYSMQK